MRIAEVRPVVVDDLPVSIYRCATPQSGQGSSALARHLMAAVKHQKRLFNLPRVKELPMRLRREVRSKTKRRVSDTLSWQAAEQLPRGAFRFAAASVLAAFHLCPLQALRPTYFGVFWRSVVAQLQKRSHLTGETNID